MISATCLRQVSISIAVALLAAASLAAQMPGPGGASPQPGQPQEPGQQAPVNPAAANMPEQTSMQNMVDSSFVLNTMENDQDQIRLSQLAQQKSPSPDVKQYSEQMIKIHSELDDQLRPLAKRMNVAAPKGPSKKEKKELEKMQALSGTEFDTAYIQAMGRAQRECLKHFHSEANDSQNAALRQAASQDTAPLTQNYQMLEKLAQAHNVNLDAKEKK